MPSWRSPSLSGLALMLAPRLGPRPRALARPEARPGGLPGRPARRPCTPTSPTSWIARGLRETAAPPFSKDLDARHRHGRHGARARHPAAGPGRSAAGVALGLQAILTAAPSAGEDVLPVHVGGQLHQHEERQHRADGDREPGVALEEERVAEQHQEHELGDAGLDQGEAHARRPAAGSSRPGTR